MYTKVYIVSTNDLLNKGWTYYHNTLIHADERISFSIEKRIKLCDKIHSLNYFWFDDEDYLVDLATGWCVPKDYYILL